ncbi:unnamed protein product [Merluccius merluccius]
MNRRHLRLLLLSAVALLSCSYWVALWRRGPFRQAGSDGSPATLEDLIDSNNASSIISISSSVVSSTVLPPCPADPPGLVGPMRVEFDWRRTMEDVRRGSSAGLRDGGRYSPPDCVSRHKVAIIIPFRDRHEHLKHWLYYLHPILKRQQLDYGVYVIHQHGTTTFNRAKLLNVGFVEALKEYAYDCFVFSDVDLVPMDDRNVYRCHGEPRHMASAMDKFGFRLPYKTYFGGVVALTRAQYMLINGFSNTYWGWGAEDDDMYKRILRRKMTVSRPDSKVGMYKMVRHTRDAHNEENPHASSQLSLTAVTMDNDGINTLKYTVKRIDKDQLHTMILVDIHGPK